MYQDETRQENCKNCTEGHYCQTGFQQPCGEGKEAPSKNTVECSDCPVGHFAEKLGTVNCEMCAEGFHKAKLGQTSCDKCDAGHFCTSGAMTECPFGEYSSEQGRNSCDLCDEGFYSTLVVGSINCTVCPVGHKCPEKGTGLVRIIQLQPTHHSCLILVPHMI